MNRQQTCRAAGPDPSGLMPSSFPGLLRGLSSCQNAYKTSTKCDQNHECEFFTLSPTGTYNFDPLNWSHFPTKCAFPLPGGEAQGEGQTGSSAPLALCVFALNPDPKTNKTERFRTKLPRDTVQSCHPRPKMSPFCHHFCHCKFVTPHFQLLTKLETSNGDIFLQSQPATSPLCSLRSFAAIPDPTKMGNFETDSHFVGFRPHRTNDLRRHQDRPSHFAYTYLGGSRRNSCGLVSIRGCLMCFGFHTFALSHFLTCLPCRRSTLVARPSTGPGQ
jgi:hypothetical protein